MSGRVLRLGRFVWERFPPLSYGPLVAALVLCGTVAAGIASDRQPAIGSQTLLVALVVGLAFLQLRVLDEIRDVDVDRVGRPERPVPRGLVSVRELRGLGSAAAVVGAVTSAAIGSAALIAYAVAAVTIWLLGTGQLRRTRFGHSELSQALTHSIIAPELLLFVFAAASVVGPTQAFIATVVLVWGVSLALEVGRKTVQPSEERVGVPTYSAELGRTRALGIVALAIAVACLGAGALAIAAGAAPWTVAIPASGAIAIPVSIGLLGRHIGTGALRVTSAGLVIALLLWPLAVLAGSR